MLHALHYSLQGLRQGLAEPAFLQESLLALVLLPAAFFVGQTWVETGLLMAVVLLVLVVELLNTAVEAAIDRIGPQWHDLSKRAKDMGSAAVLLSVLLCGTVWVMALIALWKRMA